MSENEYKEIFAQRLQDLLDKRDIKQYELANILGVSESTVGKWLLKINLPRMGVIQQLSDYFNVPKTYFLEEEIDDTPYDPDALEILEMLETNKDLKMLFMKTGKLSDADKKRIAKIIQASLPEEYED